LKIAAKVDRVDEAYYAEVVRPLLRDPLIEFVGEIGEAEKASFLGDAQAVLFPIDWPEPFGLVMIEAMACGTPVIAYRCGSVPEVVEDGVTGYIVDSIEGAVAAVDRLGVLNRTLIRRRFEDRFSIERMAREYLAVYNGAQDMIQLPAQPPMSTTSPTAVTTPRSMPPDLMAP
jgi:glycosyltransferase involved in cell wall biosynthesis